MGATSLLEKYKTFGRKQNAAEKEGRRLRDPWSHLPAFSWPLPYCILMVSFVFFMANIQRALTSLLDTWTKKSRKMSWRRGCLGWVMRKCFIHEEVIVGLYREGRVEVSWQHLKQAWIPLQNLPWSLHHLNLKQSDQTLTYDTTAVYPVWIFIILCNLLYRRN